MFSLWLMPDDAASKKLSDIIKKLSHEYETPLFEPHITILSNIDSSKSNAIHAASDLSVEVFTQKIKLTKLAHHNDFFKCIHYKVDYTSQISELYQLARDRFGGLQSKSFMPHLSIVYGTFEPDKRERIISNVPTDAPVLFDARRLCLVNTKSQNPAEWEYIDDFAI